MSLARCGYSFGSLVRVAANFRGDVAGFVGFQRALPIRRGKGRTRVTNRGVGLITNNVPLWPLCNSTIIYNPQNPVLKNIQAPILEYLKTTNRKSGYTAPPRNLCSPQRRAGHLLLVSGVLEQLRTTERRFCLGLSGEG